MGTSNHPELYAGAPILTDSQEENPVCLPVNETGVSLLLEGTQHKHLDVCEVNSKFFSLQNQTESERPNGHEDTFKGI